MNKVAAARGWVVDARPDLSWRVVRVTEDGFFYMAAGWTVPRYKSFGDHYAEHWQALALRYGNAATV